VPGKKRRKTMGGGKNNTSPPQKEKPFREGGMGNIRGKRKPRGSATGFHFEKSKGDQNLHTKVSEPRGGGGGFISRKGES